MDSPVYRIEIRAHSSLYYFIVSSLLLLSLWALWLWPYYLPTYLKLALALVLLILFIWEIRAQSKDVTDKVLSLSQKGRLAVYGKHTELGWLQPNSRVYLGFYCLSYLSDLEQSKRTLIIYTDQVDERDRRRLSRIIYAVKLG